MWALVRTYQAGRAYWISASWSERTQKGYSWRIVSACQHSSRALSSRVRSRSHSFTQRPAYSAGAISGSKPPSGRTAQSSDSSGLACCSRRSSSKSTSPKAGAMCTTPVPASSSTKSAATTRQ